MKNILEIKRAERQEKEKIREERRYREYERTQEYKTEVYAHISKHHYMFFNQFFIFGVSLGTIAILMMYYIGDKGNDLNAALALFPFASFSLLVHAIMEMLNAVHNTARLDVNKDINKDNEELIKKEKKAYKLFKFSIILLLIGMILIFCCKIHLISKILLLYDSYCQFIS